MYIIPIRARDVDDLVRVGSSQTSGRAGGRTIFLSFFNLTLEIKCKIAYRFRAGWGTRTYFVVSYPLCRAYDWARRAGGRVEWSVWVQGGRGECGLGWVGRGGGGLEL